MGYAIATFSSFINSLLISIVLLSFPFSIFSHATYDEPPVVFNFGDSNSDTGGFSATFLRRILPYGTTYFHGPSKRASDGRLIIDFIAEKLGIPHLSAYLDSIAPDFGHGANFASAGATVQPATGQIYDALFNPLTVTNVQVPEFLQFKDRTIELYEQDKTLWAKSHLPRPRDFSKALYTLDCGQNDLAYGLQNMKDEQEVAASIPYVISEFALAVKNLYKGGARKFWIHNTGPIGCLPVFIKTNPPKPGNADRIGCIKSYNLVAKDYNKQLKQTVAKLRTELPDALLVLVDMYFAKYSIISQANNYGFVDPLDNCCGHIGSDYTVDCADTKTLPNGTIVFGDNSCSDLSKHLNWDGTHYSEAANKIIASKIIDGSLSDPLLSIFEVLDQDIAKPIPKEEIEAAVVEGSKNLMYNFLAGNGPLDLHL